MLCILLYMESVAVVSISKALRLTTLRTKPEFMCLLTVGTIILGLPMAGMFRSQAIESLPPLQHGFGRILSVEPGPIEAQNLATLTVKAEVYSTKFTQGTIAAIHRNLTSRMFVPATFRLRYARGSLYDITADFGLARDENPEQGNVAACGKPMISRQ